jgi:hypothetical protein
MMGDAVSSFSMRSRVPTASPPMIGILWSTSSRCERTLCVFFLSPLIFPTASFTIRKCAERLLALSLAMRSRFCRSSSSTTRGTMRAIMSSLTISSTTPSTGTCLESFARSSHTHVSISILNMNPTPVCQKFLISGLHLWHNLLNMLSCFRLAYRQEVFDYRVASSTRSTASGAGWRKTRFTVLTKS